MKIFMILLTGLTFSFCAYSQSVVKGKIQDSTARSGLSGATIQLRNPVFQEVPYLQCQVNSALLKFPMGHIN